MSGYYSELARHPDSACINGWRHRLGQWLRFEVVLRGLDVDDDADLVDLGCGTGELWSYLGGDRPGRYLGVDRLRSSISRARSAHPSGEFICAELFDPAVDEEGPFDFAVAVGTMVDGRIGRGGLARFRQAARLIDRLSELGRRGWALVILNQTTLEDDLVRSLESCLQGASRAELETLLQRRGLDAVIDDDALPSDFFVISHRHDSSEQIRGRIAGDDAHKRVIARSDSGGQNAACDRARFWLVAGRVEEARRELEAISDGDPQKRIMMEKLDLL